MLKELLTNEALHDDVLLLLKAAEKEKLDRLQAAVQVNEEGNIVRLHQALLSDNASRQLSYLIGSIGFLYDLVNTQLNTGLLPGNGRRQLVQCKTEIVALLIELFAELVRNDPANDIDYILENIWSKKIAIRDELVQSDFGWSLLLFGSAV